MAQIIPTGIDTTTGQAQYLRNNDDQLVTGANTAAIAWQLNVGGGQGLNIFGNFPEDTGNGGNVQINGGDGGPTSGDGGYVYISSGGAANGVSGDVEILGGTSESSLGGWIELTAGDSAGASIGGNIVITGGNTGSAGIGGPITITAGEGGTGGGIDIKGGNTTDLNQTGGSIDIRAGDGRGPTGDGGQTIINGGYSGGEGGTAGDLQLGSIVDYTNNIIIGDAGDPGLQDLIVYANFNLDIGASTNIQIGNETDAPGLILMDPGGIRITPNTGTILEVGPTYYDPANGQLIRIGNSVFIDGDGVNNLVYGGDGAAATDPGEQLYIRGGNGNTTGAGGLLRLEGGAGGATTANGGEIQITSGAAGATSGTSGSIFIYSGVVASGSDSGLLDFGTNNTAGAGSTGDTFFGSGNAAGSGNTGVITAYTGNSVSGASGQASLTTGNAATTVGDILLETGGGPAGGNVIFHPNDVIGGILFNGRAQGQQGNDIASANDITLTIGNYFDITGNTTINRIASANWRAGSVVYLRFDSNPVVANGVASGGGFATILLNGSANFNTTAGSAIILLFDGSAWVEFGRMTR